MKDERARFINLQKDIDEFNGNFNESYILRTRKLTKFMSMGLIVTLTLTTVPVIITGLTVLSYSQKRCFFSRSIGDFVSERLQFEPVSAEHITIHILDNTSSTTITKPESVPMSRNSHWLQCFVWRLATSKMARFSYAPVLLGAQSRDECVLNARMTRLPQHIRHGITQISGQCYACEVPLVTTTHWWTYNDLVFL